MQRLALLALLPSTLALFACDRGDELEANPEADPVEERDAELVDEADDAEAPSPHHRRRHHARRGDPAQTLCERLSCTDDQAQRITALFEAHRPEGERPPREDRRAAKQALARAFGSDTLSADDLAAYRRAKHPEDASRSTTVVALATGLHEVLDAEQRATMAQKIERRGLPMAGRRGGRGHHGRRGGPDASRGTEHLCAPLSCTNEQRTAIEALLTEHGEARDPSGLAEARTALAEAFRSDALTADAVEAYLEAEANAEKDRHGTQDAMVLGVHGVLDSAQRATAAERIEHHGLRGLLGDKGEHRGGKGKHRKGKGKRLRRPAGDAPEAFG